jgi:transcriptional regulator with XRE-family HTH domain
MIPDAPSEQFLAGIGGRVRERRKSFGLTLDGLAEVTDMSKTGLWQVEKGRSEPGAGTLARLALALSVSVDWIIFGDES